MTAGYTVSGRSFIGWNSSLNSKNVLAAASGSRPFPSSMRDSTMIETSNRTTRYERQTASLGKSRASTSDERRDSQTDYRKKKIAIILLVMKGLDRVPPARSERVDPRHQAV
ncbi:hypothetical protein XPA_007226 [Xanthoria parietina]